MEKFSSIDNIVGAIPEEEKEQILEEYAEKFDNQEFEVIKGKERQKTPEEIELIDVANRLTDEVRTKYGLESFPIPKENVHIIKKNEYPKGRAPAVYSQHHQAIVICEAPASIAFMNKTLHEMIHMKSYNALQVTTGKDSKLDVYRMGLGVKTRDGGYLYLNDLNEAVTEEIGIRLLGKLREHPLIKKDIEYTRAFVRDRREELTQRGKDLITQDTFYVSADEDGIFLTQFGRTKERAILGALIEKIFDVNSDQFKDKEEIFDIFSRAMITGHILQVGKLIDHSFGEGTLRKIAGLDGKLKEQREFVESL